jgi:hypothetical protein
MVCKGMIQKPEADRRCSILNEKWHQSFKNHWKLESLKKIEEIFS